MKAHIINIGDELLIGQTVNTNASWMGEILDANGILVAQSVSISDTKIDILNAVDAASKIADVVLITGGLGPTKDDITKHTLCEYFGTTLVRDESVYQTIKVYFEERGKEMLQVHDDQALLPDNCTVLINKMGTASGMWFEKDGVIFISMPGVPYEMHYLMEFEVMPRLSKINNFNIHHETIKTIGIGETSLAVIIEDWENRLLADGLKLAYLPSPGIVKLRVSSFGRTDAENKKIVKTYVNELKQLVPQYIYGKNKEQLAEIVGELLIKENKTVGFCESCTGGYLSHLLTEISGSSQYYNGSVVCYTNHLKNKLLNVSKETIATYGAVSEAVVKEMVLGGLDVLEVDFAIAISGVAGPNGGTALKPVGMVCVGVGNKDKVKTFTFQFGNDRGRNITMSAIYALNELRKFIINKN